MNAKSPKGTRSFLTRQSLNSREEQSTYRVLQATVLTSLFASLAGLAAVFVFPSTQQALAIVATMSALLLVSYILLRQHILLPARIMAPFALYTMIVSLMWVGSGIHDISMIALGGVVILASFTLGNRGAYVFAGMIIIAEFVTALAEMNGILVTDASYLASLDDPFIVSAVILGIAYAQTILMNRLNLSLQDARDSENAQTEANRELTELKNALEVRVMDRTAELGRRVSQLEAVSTVARAISTVQDLDRLLPTVARVVSERFGYYHTGIFLIDERGEYAILQASNSAGGQRMLERGHRLRVGMTGIVGTVAAQGQPRIALDVGADAVYFNNPDLPETRSEIALPLKIGGQIIGILDVQSKETGAFHQEDIAVLGVLANQVAIAIENARLFSQTKQALDDSQAVYQQYVRQDWARFARTFKNRGYSYNGIRTVPLDSAALPPSSQALTIPILVRGLTAGSIVIQSSNPLRAWSQDDINLAKAAAERAGLALENFRLLSEAQRRAAKEHTIGEITARIGSSMNMDAILQNTVEELGRIMPGSEVVLQLKQ